MSLGKTYQECVEAYNLLNVFSEDIPGVCRINALNIISARHTRKTWNSTHVHLSQQTDLIHF